MEITWVLFFIHNITNLTHIPNFEFLAAVEVRCLLFYYFTTIGQYNNRKNVKNSHFRSFSDFRIVFCGFLMLFYIGIGTFRLLPLICARDNRYPYISHQFSIKEQHQLDVIRNNLQLDPINNHFTTTYPYECNPDILEGNRDQALGMMKKTEKRLSRNATYVNNLMISFREV